MINVGLFCQDIGLFLEKLGFFCRNLDGHWDCVPIIIFLCDAHVNVVPMSLYVSTKVPNTF